MSTKKLVRDHKWRRENVPYLIVFGPDDQAAVYNRFYEKLDERISPELKTHVRQHHRHKKTGFRLSQPEQQPTWMTEDLKPKCSLLFTYDDGDVINYDWIAAIPLS